MNHLLLPIAHKLILKSRYMKALHKSSNITSSSDQFWFDLLGSLSNHDDGNKNLTNLHIWRWKTVFLNVLVLSMTWNDLFCSCVDDVSIWWQMFNFILCPKRWFQINSRTVRRHLSSIMTLNNWNMIAEKRSYIIFQMTFSLSSTSCLLSSLLILVNIHVSNSIYSFQSMVLRPKTICKGVLNPI